MYQKKKIAMMLIIALLFQLILPIMEGKKVVAFESINQQEKLTDNIETDLESKVETNLETIKFGTYTNRNKEIGERYQETVKETNTVLDDIGDISEAYLEWNALSEEEKKDTVEPRKEYIDISELSTNEQFVTSPIQIPERYNLRDRFSNIKTEYQGFTGNCYAYAALNAIETNIAIKTGTMYDFSEMHVEYMTSNLLGGNRTLNAGGNFQTVVNYSKNLQGPVLESEIPNRNYDENEYSMLKNAKPITTVTETVEFPTINKRYGYTEDELTEFRNTVKTHIMEKGSVYASMYFSESSKYYNSTTKGYACLDTSVLTNHAVSIIGWDDSYSKDNFPETNRPINNGAWIALNSYGNSFGDDGVFYISYEDNWIEYNMSGVVSIIDFEDTYGPEIELIDYKDENNVISSTVEVYDIGGSGIDNNSLKYVWTQSEYEPNIEAFTESFINGSTLTKEYEDGEKWYLWILAYDNNDNYSIYGAGVVNIKFNDRSLYNNIKEKFSYCIKGYDDQLNEIQIAKEELDKITNISINYMIDDLSGLEMFKNLEKLSFRTSSNFKSQDILQQFDKLKNLSITYGSGLSDIKFIENLNTLEYLYLSELTELKDINIDFPDNIKRLHIDNCDKLENINANYPEGLEELGIRYCENLKDISNISFPNGLEKIRIVNNSIQNINNIHWPDNLKYLSLQDNDIGLVNGSVWPNTLEILDLSFNSINDITNINLPSGLIELYIGGNKITDISNLGNLTNLQLFSAGDNYIENINVIENMTNLKWVYLGSTVWWCYYFYNGEGPYHNILGYERDHGNNIKNINIKWPETITTIELDDNKIEDVLEVNWPKDLERLDLRNNLIENISIQMGQYFNSLYLSNNKIKDISKIIISNKCITKDGYNYQRQVFLDNNNIDNIPIELWKNSEIHTLILSNNNITNIDNVIWAQGLDSLELSDNNINVINGANFGNLLRYLIINNNEITEINNVTWPSSFKAIEIAENNITNLSWIESCTNLMGLALNKNKVKSIESLSTLSKLQELHLDCNMIEDVNPIESLLSLTKFSIKNQDIIKVVDDTMQNIETPSIIKNSMQTGSKVYTNNPLGLINCNLENDRLAFSYDNIGNIRAIITGGNASGSTVHIIGSNSNDFIKYKVYTKEDLANIREIINNGDISDIEIDLMNDIDLGGYFNETSQSWEGEEWIPIGNEAHHFKCIFNGNGYKISGIYINSSESYQGFIGYNEGIIKNLGIGSGYINGQSMVGGIAGYNAGKIIECHNISDIKGFSNIGGIAGFGGESSGNARIAKCYNSGNINASYGYASGILGQATYAIKVEECYNTGTINSNSNNSYVAGIVANLNSSSVTSIGTLEINNCFNAGEINGAYAGGIISGLAIINNKYQGSINNCYNIGEVNGTKSSGAIKGTEGMNKRIKDRNIKNCYYLKKPDLNAIGNNDDIENNVYGLNKAFMKTTEFVNLLNAENENEVWKLAESYYKYPVLSWQTIYPDFSDEVILTEISVTKAPNKTSYAAGQNFETEGMVVTATYNDGNSKEVTNYTVTDGENLIAGKTSVTISYEENGVTKTATQNITVVAKALTGIAVTTEPTRTSYAAGQNFETEGMVVTATYNDGNSKEVTNYTVTDGENLIAGKTSVTISYTENGITKTTTQNITVVAKALTGITVKKEPTKTSYVAGQNFEKAGMNVIASYNDGSSKEVTNYIVTDGENLTAGKTSVTISYTEGNVTRTAVQNITVLEKLSIEIHDFEEIQKEEKTYIESINPGTTVKILLEKIETNGTVEIFKGTQKVTNINTKLATGMTLKISLNNELIEHTIVVTGDLNGDGEMGDIDVLRLARYRAGLDKNLAGAYLQAANIFKDKNYADDIDLLKMVRILVGLDSLTK